MDWVLAALLGYLLGSIPFGLILAFAAGKGDVRSIGSGNIGATNVLRTGSKGLAAATLMLDLMKGFTAVWLAWRWFPEWAGMAALGAVLGHCFPVWLRFRGGKGVATTAGVCFGIGWVIGLVYAVVWLGLLAITRISSLAGMSAAVAAPVAAALMGLWELVPVLAAIAVIILALHRENIRRLAAGTEPKVGRR
ncbi:glycerol-3-phosphate 1-O-acyltransferase PlsY [Altericroceibacterium xinjiangense]|uniref:glycerol-3-phosphate 1-O-acyltransferase PlsY n=1 Tax=Altericroceibacterium xinjiangense TaxID=762261 RepID=UPI000F7F9B30|nr:glycerol-3-phosphate 1-O-acyltransferase PlsY [Altericroceibacterium xinjiangense]